jgi:hypothetical protein
VVAVEGDLAFGQGDHPEGEDVAAVVLQFGLGADVTNLARLFVAFDYCP